MNTIQIVVAIAQVCQALHGGYDGKNMRGGPYGLLYETFMPRPTTNWCVDRMLKCTQIEKIYWKPLDEKFLECTRKELKEIP